MVGYRNALRHGMPAAGIVAGSPMVGYRNLHNRLIYACAIVAGSPMVGYRNAGRADSLGPGL